MHYPLYVLLVFRFKIQDSIKFIHLYIIHSVNNRPQMHFCYLHHLITRVCSSEPGHTIPSHLSCMVVVKLGRGVSAMLWSQMFLLKYFRKTTCCAEHLKCVSHMLASLVPEPHGFIRDRRKRQVDIALKYEYHQNGTDDRNQHTRTD